MLVASPACFNASLSRPVVRRQRSLTGLPGGIARPQQDSRAAVHAARRGASLPALQRDEEPFVLKLAKAALLVPMVMSVVWAGPAHAAKKKASAIQVVQEASTETSSPLEQLQARFEQLQLQARFEQLLQQATRGGSQAAAQVQSASEQLLQQATRRGSQAAAQVQSASAVAASEATTLQQRVSAEMERPEVRNGLIAVTVLFLFAFAVKAASSGSKSSATIDIDSGASSGSAAAATSNGHKPAAASAPVAAAAAAPARKDATTEEQLRTAKQAADRVTAEAAATAAKHADAAAAKAKAAAESAKAAVAEAHAAKAPAPPAIVKPVLPAAASHAAAAPAPASSASSASNSNGASRVPRAASPPLVGPLPDRGAATPALAVLGAGAVLLDLLSPFGSLLAGTSRNGSRNNGATAPKTPSATPATPVEPSRPSTPSLLEQAAAAAVAEAEAEAANGRRAVPTELPVVTLAELERAVGAPEPANR